MLTKLRRSQFINDYGSIFVLLLLCAYYSYATYSIQHPITEQAGSRLAERILDETGGGDTVLVVVRKTDGDIAFANAIATSLTRHDRVRHVVPLDSPAKVREALVELGASQTDLVAIAANQPTSIYGPIREDSLEKLAKEYPSLAEVKVFTPRPYYWPSFLTRENLVNVVNQNADVAIIAIGMTLVIITAGIDLSVGSLLAVAAVVTAILLESLGGANASVAMMTASAFLGLAICAACGLFNGLMVTWFRVPAFIVTLATMMIARGIALILAVSYQSSLTGGATEGTPEAVKISAESFSWLGNGELFGVPNPIILMIVLYLGAHFVMSQTAFGRYVYAVGGNSEAARLSGVPVTGILIAVYVICATMAGVSGVVDASRFEGGRPNAGDLYELKVIAAVVVGGTSLAGGEGKIFGTLIGAMIIAVIENGLNMAGVKSYEQKVVFGLLILGAVVLDQLKKRW